MFHLNKEQHAPVVLTLLLHTMVLVGLSLISLGESGQRSVAAPDSPQYVRASIVQQLRLPPRPEPEPTAAPRPEPQPAARPSLPEPEPIVSDRPSAEPQLTEALEREQRKPEQLPQEELQQVQQRVQEILANDEVVDPTIAEADPNDSRISDLLEQVQRQLDVEPEPVVAALARDPIRVNSDRELALSYLARNKKLVERNFNVGGVSQKQLFAGLRVRLLIDLDGDGKLLNAEIVESSGNELFDQKAVNAVRRVGKFIIPIDPEISARYFRQIVMDYSL